MEIRDDADPTDNMPNVYANKDELEMTAQNETIDALEDIEQDLGELLEELNLDADLGDDNLLIDEDDDEEEKGDEE